MVTRQEIGRYLAIDPDSITEIDGRFYNNYYKIYASEPSSKVKSQYFAEFRCRYLKQRKSMITDGYSWSRINGDVYNMRKSFNDARDFAVHKFIIKTGLHSSAGIIANHTGVFSYVYIIPKSSIRTPRSEGKRLEQREEYR